MDKISAYEVKGKYAIVTGAGSGICLAFAQQLLEAGCTVMIADLKLRPEAEDLLSKWSTTDGSSAAAHYRQTDVSDWAQLLSMWNETLGKFGQIDIVCNGAGIYEPPSSSFWKLPGISSVAGDDPGASLGAYKTFSVNTMAPIRLAQIAIDYWLENRHVDGNILWIASVGAYIHLLQTPLYFASKAAIMSIVKSLSGLRRQVGIRNSAVCPGAVHTPIFSPEYCRDRLKPDDLALSPSQAASVMMTVLTEPQYGDGNIVEVMMVGNKESQRVATREVPLETLYPTAGITGEQNHILEEEDRVVQRLQKHALYLTSKGTAPAEYDVPLANW